MSCHSTVRLSCPLVVVRGKELINPCHAFDLNGRGRLALRGTGCRRIVTNLLHRMEVHTIDGMCGSMERLPMMITEACTYCISGIVGGLSRCAVKGSPIPIPGHLVSHANMSTLERRELRLHPSVFGQWHKAHMSDLLDSFV